jgi:hypothetical protein
LPNESSSEPPGSTANPASSFSRPFGSVGHVLGTTAKLRSSHALTVVGIKHFPSTRYSDS